MTTYERTYKTSRSVIGLIEIIGWIATLAGLVLLPVSLSLYSDNFFSFSLGLFTSASAVIFFVAGLSIVVYSQIARASIDTAEMTRDMLQMARAKYEKEFGVAFVPTVKTPPMPDWQKKLVEAQENAKRKP